MKLLLLKERALTINTTLFLNNNLIVSYLSFIRGEGAKSILPTLKDVKPESLSTPLLAWFAHHKRELPEEAVLLGLIERDIARSRFIIGYDSINTDLVENCAEFETIYKEALSLIQTYFPEMSKIIKSISPIVSYPIEGKTFESASHPHTFGQIYYRMDSTCPVKWAEILVHETAHHYVEALTVATKELNQKKDILIQERDSAIRGEKRPLIGVFHGAIAQACMLHFAMNIIKNSKNLEHIDGARRTLTRFSTSFNKDRLTLKESGLSDFHNESWKFITNIANIIDEENIK